LLELPTGDWLSFLTMIPKLFQIEIIKLYHRPAVKIDEQRPDVLKKKHATGI
jgi:hypothetical protein